MMKPFDCYVIGAGLCGLSAARYLAEHGKRVLVIEQSNRIGGLCGEGYWNNTRFSVFGPHIFHTSDNEVWEFLSRFTEWNYDVLHYVKSYDCGKLWSIPIDYSEVSGSLNADEMLKFRLYEKYNQKMWGKDYQEVMKTTIRRLQHRMVGWDIRYFSDTYQGFPDQGYNLMFGRMTHHELITVITGSPFAIDAFLDLPIIYTGRIDKLLGKDTLPYRTMEFVYQLNGKLIWSDIYPVINFPVDYDFIRAHSSKMLYKQKTEDDVIVYEYPGRGTVDCYPILTETNVMFYSLLRKELKQKHPNLIAAGRLGTYTYMNMDQAVRSGIDSAKKVLDS